jgi:hypothetical protein
LIAAFRRCIPSFKSDEAQKLIDKRMQFLKLSVGDVLQLKQRKTLIFIYSIKKRKKKRKYDLIS